METVDPKHFFDLEIRVGTVLEVLDFPEARKPAFKLILDFGEFGIKKSSAQICDLYSKEDLIGNQIIAVLNFPKKQIGPFLSECLVLGLLSDSGVVLIKGDRKVANGLRLA